MNYVVISLTVFIQIVFSQMIELSEIDTTKIKSWNVKDLIEFEGLYHFGESEAESKVMVIINSNESFARIEYGILTSMSFKVKQINLTDLKIKQNGNFTSKKHSGRFIIYNGIKSLLVNKYPVPFSSNSNYDVGVQRENNSVSAKFKESFSIVFLKKLIKQDIIGLSKHELKIMRNAIFAQYGFIFKPSGEIRSYFDNKSWYVPKHKDINKKLTDIDQHNINLIRKLEQ